MKLHESYGACKKQQQQPRNKENYFSARHTLCHTPSSISDTFFQTLPELITPLKLHREEELVLFISAQLSTDAAGAL